MVRIVAGICLLMLAAGIVLQVPDVQTALGAKIISGLKDKFDGNLSFSTIKILPFNTVIVNEVAVTDDNPYSESFFERVDTIFCADRVVISFSLKGLTDRDCIRIRKLTVSGASLCAIKDPRGPGLRRVFKNGEISEPDSISAGPDILVRRIEVNDFHLRLLNTRLDTRPYKGHGICWDDFDGFADVQAHDLRISGGKIEWEVDDLKLHEKSGYSILHAKGNACYTFGHVTVSDFHLEDPWMDLYVPKYEMIYPSRKAFNMHFVDSVYLHGAIRNSSISLKSIGYYGGTFKDATGMLDVSLAVFDGPVNNLEISEFIFEEKHGTRGRLSCTLHDAAEPGKLTADAQVRRFSFRTSSLSDAINSFGITDKVDLSRFAPGVNFIFSGSMHGRKDKLDIRARVNSGIGSINASGSIASTGTQNPQAVSTLDLHTEDLDIGILTGKSFVHQCTMGARLHADINGRDADIELDSLTVDRLNVLGYDYSGIAAAGTYSGDAFNGRIISTDPNLNFLFQGTFSLSNKTNNALYRFYCNIGYADLYAMNLDKRGKSKASAQISADYINLGGQQLIGSINVSNLNLENSREKHRIGDVSFVSRRNDGIYRVNMNSDFADASFTGSESIPGMIRAMKELALGKNLPSLLEEPSSKWNGETYSLEIQAKDSRKLFSFVSPGIYVADGSTLDAGISTEGQFSASLHSQRIASGRNYLKDLEITADNYGDSLRINVHSGEINAGNTKLHDNALHFAAASDSLALRYSFDNQEERQTSGALDIEGRVSRNDGVRLTLDATPSDIYVKGHKWTVRASSLQMDTTLIRVDSLELRSGDQMLALWGGYSRTLTDTLHVNMGNFHLSPIAELANLKTQFDGNLNGAATITSPFNSNAGVILDLQCDSTFISGHEAGTVMLSSTRSEDSGVTDIRLSNDIEGRQSINASGKLYSEEGRLAAKVDLKEFSIGYFSGLMRGVFNEWDGSVSGEFSVVGPLRNLSVFSRGSRIDDALMKVEFTEVPYHISGPFQITDDGVTFDGTEIRDEASGRGGIKGGIRFDHLRDFRLDMHMNMSDMLVLDKLQTGVGEPVFGTVYAGGTLDITGPFEAPVLHAAATTTGNSDLFIPLGNGHKSSQTDLLTFKEENAWVDPYESMLKGEAERQRKAKSNLALNLDVSVTPDLLLRLNLDNNSNNVISGRGRGDIGISIDPGDNSLSAQGIYTLNEGNFRFSVAGIANRNFSINNGSSISLVGDIMDSDLDINATYSTKTSLDRIMGEQNAVTSRRTVNCGLHVFDKLRNPQLGFSIDVPDLSPEAQSYLLSALNTEDKVQKQFLSLIVSNSFLPNDDAGIVNNTNVLLSNAADIMAGQLNNILQMLKIPLDLGFNYQQTTGGTNIFDVAVSTQLFNNRVIVNGTVGNRAQTTSKQDFVGDLDIEMKLDRSGNIRASLFSHSADKFTNYLDNSQRNGLGISCQTEFNAFREFISNLFHPKKKREALKAARTQQKKLKTINITADGNDK